MGKSRKRAAPFSGLSSYVQQAFGTISTDSAAPIESASTSREPPQKRPRLAEETVVTTQRETHYTPQWVEKYDATGIAPHYSHHSEVPEPLKKYFSQRTRYFSEYSTAPGCLLDEEGWYSVTPEAIADQIAERCRCDTILDAFCGVGGNTIAFARTCQRVIALDTSPVRLALARHNAQIYGVAERIEFILADYCSFVKSYTSLPPSASRKIDVVFLSPPWGGPSYLSGAASPEPRPYSLSAIQPIHGADLFNLTRKITRNIAYYLPRNSDLDEIGRLLESGEDESEVQEFVEVEEEWMGNKLKALTCYFGGLVDGQDAMF